MIKTVPKLAIKSSIGACTACHGTGRHVFEIEVQCPNIDSWGDPCEGNYEIAQSEWRPRPLCDGFKGKPGKVAYRVHVVPGMVVPIVEEPWSGWCDPGKITQQLRKDGDQYRAMIGNWRSVALPPAAKPGMWAVLLVEVHA